MGKEEEAFSSFPIMFSTLSEREIITSAKLILSSANIFNLVQSEILPFGKNLKPNGNCQLQMISIWKSIHFCCVVKGLPHVKGKLSITITTQCQRETVYNNNNSMSKRNCL